MKRKRKRGEGKEKLLSWKLQCNTVGHAVNPFSIHLYMQAFIAQNHWPEAPRLCYTTDTGPSLGLFLNITLLPCAVEIL